jgi:hypothetical protein
MFNLREPTGEYSETTVTTATTSTILSHTLTNIEEVDEDAVHESLDHQEGFFSHVIPCDFFKQT